MTPPISNNLEETMQTVLNRLCFTGFGHSKSQSIVSLVQKLRCFCRMGLFCLNIQNIKPYKILSILYALCHLYLCQIIKKKNLSSFWPRVTEHAVKQELKKK